MTGRTLLVATTNKGKIREFSDLLKPLGFTVVSPADFKEPAPDVEETGVTFEENAALKARAYAAHYRLPALADDSGLTVSALNGAPGVRSARYAGADATDADNVAKLLEALKDIPDSRRQGAFVCVLCLALPGDNSSGGTETLFRGECRGMIAREPRGAGGFGYDPVFIHPEFSGRSFAEISKDEKNRVSHRGEAVKKFVASARD